MRAADESYRPDIDGLRAVAVLAVVAFHAFPQWLPGGYIGVDVFFVISGFLISRQLIAAAAAGEFSFGGFYARRIRRIFPALIVVLIATGVAGWYALLPHEWQELQRHIAASALFANNIALWSEAGYFDGPSELKPLLHLWSLGVEEQFYLIWPALIWWWWCRGVRVLAGVAIVVLTSFAINVMVVNEGAATAAFFLPHTRLWQLGAGALLAVLAHEGTSIATAVSRWLYRVPAADREGRINNMLSIGGVLAIVCSCIALSQGVDRPDWWSHGAYPSVSTAVYWIGRLLWLDGSPSAYPGWSAVAPTAGAMLVIAAGPLAFANRALLARRPMVFIGLISYPLYLWHWPIISFLQITEQGQVSRGLLVIAIAVSFALATLTYLFVEKPIRAAVTPATLPRVTPIVVPMAAIGLVMATAMATGWLTPPPRTALQIDTPVPLALNAASCRIKFPGLGEYCQQYDPQLPVTTALLGDSHAAHFLPGLGAALQARGATVVHLGQTGCPPLLGIERLHVTGDHTCVRVNRSMLDAVAADASITDVWLSFRGALATTGQELGEARRRDLFRTVEGGMTNAAAIREGLRVTVAFLQSRGKKVGVILQAPELGFRVDQCTGRPMSLAHGPMRSPCGVPRAEVTERQSVYRDLIADAVREFRIAVYDPLPSLCDDAFCYAAADGHILYFDDNHLGTFGSAWALRHF
jgi:peptidoglycan/LPS O-acetylase OafA/YrhL